AAISLPEIMQDGSPFPKRNEILFLTFCVIFVTLVLQGLTLPPLIRRLGLAGLAGENPEEKDARRAMAESALAYLEHAKDDEPAEFQPVYDELIRQQRHRLTMLGGESPSEDGYRAEDYERLRQVSKQVRALQRAALLHMRNQNRINDEVMRKLEFELDLMDARFSSSE
ncbi:MAG: Na+/H+ antiporter, partial [Candidatus Acidiferrales bacterium]